MKTSLGLLMFVLSALGGVALSLQPKDLSPPVPTADAEVSLTGVLQRRMSIGGETTGWVLRYDKERTIELTFSIEALKHVREGALVTCIGQLETRHYPERGEVSILTVREIRDVET